MREMNNLYRRNGKNIYIKQPEFHELAYVAKLWSDEETMRDIGGIFKFPEEKWKMFYKKMVQPTDGKNFYCLIYTIRDKAIGEVSFHGYDSATKIARFNIKIHHRYRNKGYGREAMKLLLEYYFLEFGGEMIMDNVSSQEGKKIAEKLGFTSGRQFKNDLTVRISKDSFLSINENVEHDVAILIYDDMNFLDYTLPLSILNKANEIAGRKMFNVFTVGEKAEVYTDVGTCAKREVALDYEEIKPSIMILPGANNMETQVKDKEVIRYILTHYNSCEYICGLTSAVKLLIRCRALDGVLIPNGKWIEDMEESKESLKISSKNYVDNGKLMISGNMAGTIDLCISLINKLGGKSLSEKIKKELGL